MSCTNGKSYPVRIVDKHTQSKWCSAFSSALCSVLLQSSSEIEGLLQRKCIHLLWISVSVDIRRMPSFDIKPSSECLVFVECIWERCLWCAYFACIALYSVFFFNRNVFPPLILVTATLLMLILRYQCSNSWVHRCSRRLRMALQHACLKEVCRVHHNVGVFLSLEEQFSQRQTINLFICFGSLVLPKLHCFHNISLFRYVIWPLTASY